MATSSASVSPKRVSIGDLKDMPPSRSNSVTNKEENNPGSRSNSVTRRASLPPQRVLITEASGPVLAAAAASTSVPARSNSTTALPAQATRRASVATGMMSVPFQKTAKEAPRWRPATYMAQMSKGEGLNEEGQQDRLSAEESIKPLTQKIFEKTAVSLALGIFVVLVAFILGSIIRVIVRRDLGILGLWINQIVILLIFLNDKRPEEAGGGKRMDKFTPFEVGTLICQALPILYTLLFGNPYSYYSIIVMIVMQAVLKFGLMNALGEVVEISL